MATDTQVVQIGKNWFVDTAEGRIGPIDSEQEAIRYVRLQQLAWAAGSETACTEAECLI